RSLFNGRRRRSSNKNMILRLLSRYLETRASGTGCAKAPVIARESPRDAQRTCPMANKSLFSSASRTALPPTDTFNRAGGTAYALPAKHALAQYVATGCLNGTFYASAEEQLEAVSRLCAQVEPEFIARL